MILAEVEFLQDGQQPQQRPQAAEPQQQAKAPTDINAPISAQLGTRIGLRN